MVDAVADPVRARLVRRLASSSPASLEDLAKAAGVHPNTARAHLSALEADGFVERRPQPTDRPGRPRTVFSLREDWTVPDDGFLAMAELLGAALGATRPDPRALRRLGARWGRKAVAAAGPGDAQRRAGPRPRPPRFRRPHRREAAGPDWLPMPADLPRTPRARVQARRRRRRRDPRRLGQRPARRPPRARPGRPLMQRRPSAGGRVNLGSPPRRRERQPHRPRARRGRRPRAPARPRRGPAARRPERHAAPHREGVRRAAQPRALQPDHLPERRGL